MDKETYQRLLQHPNWDAKRKQILKRDNYQCQMCGDKGEELHVHHYKYHDNPWDVPDIWLVSVCHNCHNTLHLCKPATVLTKYLYCGADAKATIIQNGYNGKPGEGGFVKIIIQNGSDYFMDVSNTDAYNKKHLEVNVKEFSLQVNGGFERDGLLLALKFFVSELEKNSHSIPEPDLEPFEI